MSEFKTFKEWCFHQHDIECNQKYDKTLPYSFHLKLVENQVQKFKYLVPNTLVYNHHNTISKPQFTHQILSDGGFGHDLIEDARVTFNDVRDIATKHYSNNVAGQMLVDIIYACTELRGKDRPERHGAEYLQGLKNNKLGLFVKLCDITANVSYGVITNSSMVKKYRHEYDDILIKHLYEPEYDDIYQNLKKILTLK